MMSKYVYVDLVPASLDSGQPLGFGAEVDLDKKAVDANKRLVESGSLVPGPKAARGKKSSNSQEGN